MSSRGSSQSSFDSVGSESHDEDEYNHNGYEPQHNEDDYHHHEQHHNHNHNHNHPYEQQHEDNHGYEHNGGFENGGYTSVGDGIPGGEGVPLDKLRGNASNLDDLFSNICEMQEMLSVQDGRQKKNLHQKLQMLGGAGVPEAAPGGRRSSLVKRGSMGRRLSETGSSFSNRQSQMKRRSLVAVGEHREVGSVSSVGDASSTNHDPDLNSLLNEDSHPDPSSRRSIDGGGSVSGSVSTLGMLDPPGAQGDQDETVDEYAPPAFDPDRGDWSAQVTTLFLRLSSALSEWNSALVAEEEFILSNANADEYEDENELLEEQAIMRRIIAVHNVMITHASPQVYDMVTKVMSLLIEKESKHRHQHRSTSPTGGLSTSSSSLDHPDSGTTPPPKPYSPSGDGGGDADAETEYSSTAAAAAANNPERPPFSEAFTAWIQQIAKLVEVLTKLIMFISGFSIRMEMGGGGDHDRHETAFFTIFELLRMTVLARREAFAHDDEEEDPTHKEVGTESLFSDHNDETRLLRLGGRSSSDADEVDREEQDLQLQKHGRGASWTISEKLYQSWQVCGHIQALEACIDADENSLPHHRPQTPSVIVGLFEKEAFLILKQNLSAHVVTFVDERRSTYTVARCIRVTASDLYIMCGNAKGGAGEGMAAAPQAALDMLQNMRRGGIPREGEMTQLLQMMQDVQLAPPTTPPLFVVTSDAEGEKPAKEKKRKKKRSSSSSSGSHAVEEGAIARGLGIGKTTLAAMFVCREDVRLAYRSGMAWLHMDGAIKQQGGDSIGGSTLSEQGKVLSYVSYCNYLQSICSQLDEHMNSDVPDFGRFVPQPDDDVMTRQMKERHRMEKAKEQMKEFLQKRYEMLREGKKSMSSSSSSVVGNQILIVLDDVVRKEDIPWFQFGANSSMSEDATATGQDENHNKEKHSLSSTPGKPSFDVHLLITTQNRDFFSISTGVVEVGRMTELEAMQLLRLESDVDCSMNAAQSMVRVCDCHPLTLMTVGRWLRMKRRAVDDGEATREVTNAVTDMTGRGSASVPLAFLVLNEAFCSCFNENFASIFQSCLASLVFIFKQPMQGEVYGKKCHVSTKLAKLFWDAIFRNEECGDLLEEIRESYGANDLEVFDVVLKVLVDMGVICLLPEEHVCSNVTANTFIHFRHKMYELYGFYLASGKKEGLDKISKEYEVRWNESLVEASLDEKDGSNLLYEDSDDDYLLRMLPIHMLRAGMLEDMEQMLTDDDFVQRRLAILGCEEGARIHVQDCKELHEQLQLSGTKDEGKATQAVMFIYEKLAVALGRIMAQGDDLESEKLILDVVQGMHEMGYSLFAFRCLSQAYKYYKTSREILKYNSGGRQGEDELVAASRYSIGLVHMKADRLKKAMVHFEQSLQVWEDHLGNSNEYVAQIQFHMGTIHFQYGYYKKALENYEESLRIRKPYNHTAVPTILSKVALVNQKCGSFDAALNFYNQAIELDDANPEDARQLDLAETLNGIAIIHANRGDYDEGNRCVEHGLKLRGLTLDDDDIEVAESLHILAQIAQLRGEYQVALQWHKTALRMFKSHYGEKHVKYGEAIHTMGNIHCGMEEYTEARTCLEQALKVKKASLHASHVEVADTLHLIGMVKLKMGDRLNALPSFKEALRIRKAMLGSEHEKVAQSLNTLGLFYKELSMFDKAMVYIEKELKMRKGIGDESASVAAAYEELATLEDGRGMYDKAIKNFEEALRLKKQRLGDEHLDVADAMFKLATVNVKADNYGDAIEYMDEALRIREHKLGTADAVVVDTMHNMGTVLFKDGKYDKALRYFESALEGRRAIDGEDRDVAVAETMHGIGTVYSAMGMREKAMDTFIEALRLKRTALGDNHVGLVPTITEMGYIYSSEGDYDKAITLFEESMRLSRDSSEKTLEGADMLTKMAIIYNMKGKQEEALQCGKEALDIYRMKLSDNHEKVATALHNLGCFLSVAQRCEEALECFEQALQLRCVILGPSHDDVAATLYNVASVHNMMGDYEKALECLKEVLRIRKLGDNQAKVVDALQKIGSVYRESGDYAEAVKYYDEVLQAMKEDLGDNDMNVAAVLHALGNLEDDRRNYDKAMEYFEESLKVRVLNLGLEHEDVATSLCSIAFVHGNRGNEGEALQHLQEALRIRSFKLGLDHELVGDTHNNIAFYCCNMQKLEEAREHLWEALRIRKLLKAFHKVADTLNNLGNVHKELQEYDMAIECYQEALNLRKNTLGMRDDNGIGDTYFNLGGLYVLRDDFDNATESYEESLRIRTLQLGKDHPKVADGHSNMVEVHLKRGEHNMALLRLEEVLRIKRLHLGEHEDVANTLFNMGIIYDSKRDWESAHAKFEEAMSIYTAVGIGCENPRVASLTRSLIAVEQRMNSRFARRR